MNVITKSPARTGLVLLILFFIISLALIMKYAEKERQRDMLNWQSRLGILADMRKAAVENWLFDRKSKLKSISENSTLQLYLSQYEELKENKDNIGHAQFSHVRNLLHATAKQFDFMGLSSGAVNTGYDESNKPGLAVFSKNGELLFSTKSFSTTVSPYKDLIDLALKTGGEQFIDMFSIENKYMRYGYVMPVFHIQKMQFQDPVGAVVVLLDPVSSLFNKLQNLHLNTDSDETLLLRSEKNSTVFLSPLRGVFNIFHQIPKANMNLAANFSIHKNGGFSLKQDYRNKKVLVTARKIENTPWVLMQKIDAVEALEESNSHQQFVLITFSLLTILLVVLFVAVWKHSTSARLQRMAAKLESRTVLLNAVTDHINEHIFLIDEENHFVFANLSIAKDLNIKAGEFVGKNMASVMGPDVVDKLQELTCEQDSDSSCMIPLQLGDSNNIYHVSTIVLRQGEYKGAKLFVLHDITSLKTAQEKRDRLARGIISTLVKAVDLYDPYCIDHSERTREVAVDIAHELQLPDDRCEALEMAALLANIGKLFVPKEILTKMEALSEEESNELKRHIEFAVDILKQLDFEGPVVDIISQKNESLDGSGYPNGLNGEDIMLESRILAVSNAFVAMASSRAYRQGRPIKEVVDILVEQSGSHYDRHVVAALFHIAENKSDWNKWQIVSQDP